MNPLNKPFDTDPLTGPAPPSRAVTGIPCRSEPGRSRGAGAPASALGMVRHPALVLDPPKVSQKRQRLAAYRPHLRDNSGNCACNSVWPI